MHLSPTSKLLFRFSFQVLIGAILFGVVAVAAAALWYGTAETRVPRLVLSICELVSRVLFFLDVTFLLFFMGIGVWKILRDIWNTLRARGEAQ